MRRLSVLIVLALMVLLSAGQAVYAQGNLLPAIKVDGGWVSVVSYINTQPSAGGGVFVHATYQMKNPANFSDKCTHLDGKSKTTENDLTTTVLDTAGGGTGTVFPAGDTTGSALINPPLIATDPISEGFLVLENYDGNNVIGADGTLTSEAIVFNLTSGFFFAQRALTVNQTAINVVDIEAPFCGSCNYLEATPFSAGGGTVFSNGTGGTLTRFMFLPPATATISSYVIAANRPGTAEAAESATTFNLAAPNYDASIRLEARRDLSHGYALGLYDRLEDFRSLTVTNDVVCLAQLSIDDLTGSSVPTFITDGGWMNLAPRCRENEGGIQTCNGNGAGTELGDAALIGKVGFATGFGYAAIPQHQQWYTK